MPKISSQQLAVRGDDRTTQPEDPSPDKTQSSVPLLANLLDARAVRGFFGGSKPIDNSTLYRGIAAGRYPRPIRVGPASVRWLRSECEAAVQAMIAARDSNAT